MSLHCLQWINYRTRNFDLGRDRVPVLLGNTTREPRIAYGSDRDADEQIGRPNE
jgi:hypothetical protein